MMEALPKEVEHDRSPLWVLIHLFRAYNDTHPSNLGPSNLHVPFLQGIDCDTTNGGISPSPHLSYVAV